MYHRVRGHTPYEIPTRIGAESMKHKGVRRRLKDMHAPMRQLAFSAIRTGAMVALAMLLILGLLPAILAIQTGT